MCGEVTFLVVLNKRCWIKFVYSEKKGTNFWEISTIDLSDVVTVKSTVEISQNFVAFSEYMNFNLPNILSNYIHISIFIGLLAMKKKLDTSNVSFTWLLHWNLITISLNIQIKIASFMQSQRSDKQSGQPPLLVKVIRWLPRFNSDKGKRGWWWNVDDGTSLSRLRWAFRIIIIESCSSN